jgi:hypothetical protein
VKQIRDFLLKNNFNEIIVDRAIDPTRRYFIKEHNIVKLILSPKQMVDRLQMELICQNIGFPFGLFETWYRRAKKHKA